MVISRLSIHGNVNIGVYIFANDQIALVPKGLDKKILDIISETLNVEPIETRVADLSIIGIMVAGNNNGIILPRIIKDNELIELKKLLSKYDLNIVVAESKYTAIGNLILANDKGAVLYPEFEKNVVEKIRDGLGVDNVEQTYIAGIPVVGSIGVVTNKGGILHPATSDNELEKLEEILKVPLMTGTVNFGVVFIRSGLVANTYGVLIGEDTTGPEIVRIQEALGVK